MQPLLKQQRLPHRRGFSFAEVMFAVVILGIGFIMVAGIFPVALQQTQTTSQQASGAAFARNAAGLLQQVAAYQSGYYLPATGASGGVSYVYAFDSTANNAVNAHGSWSAILGGLIPDSDQRFAFVPLYLRPYGVNYAQLYIINTEVQTRSIYDPTDDLPTNAPTTFMPKLLSATISGAFPYLITFANGTGVSTFGGTTPFTYTVNATAAVGTGCYVIVANDKLAGNLAGMLNGKIYRVGNQRLDLNSNGLAYELVPGSDFVPQPGLTVPPTTAMDVWIVGKQLDPPVTGNYAGHVQDVSLFATFVPLQ